MDDWSANLKSVTSLSGFEDVFKLLRDADPQQGMNLEAAIRNALCESDGHIRDARGSPDRLRYWLYRRSVELKAQASSFLNYEREMATREANLWRFALECQDDFFRRLFDALDEYFGTKTDAILQEVERDAAWYTGLRDHARRAGRVVTKSAELVKAGLDYLRRREELPQGSRTVLDRTAEVVREVAELDIRDVVTRSIEMHLSKEILRNDVSAMLNEAALRYERAWIDTLHAEAPDLRDIRTFGGVSLGGPSVASPLDLGVAEQTLVTGLGGAVVGTLALAAGWHVLAYSMVYVFYPVAIATAVATLGVAVLTRERDLERRRQRVRDAVNAYHRHFIVEIDMGRLGELGGHTLRETLKERAKILVNSTLRSWEVAISGKLTTNHYRALGAACTAHLQLIQESLDQLPQVEGGPLPNET